MSHAPLNAILEHGRNALSALQYREQAALYRAAAASLQSAIQDAEAGDEQLLTEWLLKNQSLLHSIDWKHLDTPTPYPSLRGPTLHSQLTADASPAEVVSLEPVVPTEHQAPFPLGQTSPSVPQDANGSPWDSMAAEASKRLKRTDAHALDNHETNSEIAFPFNDPINAQNAITDNELVHPVENPAKVVLAPNDSATEEHTDAPNSVDKDPLAAQPDETTDSDSLSSEATHDDSHREDWLGADRGESWHSEGWHGEIDPAESWQRWDEWVGDDEAIDSLKSPDEFELSPEALEEVACLEPLPPTRETISFWNECKSPAVWTSFAVHSLVIGALSFVVMRTIQETEVLGIVAATYESDAILTETPMETLSPLDTSSIEMSELNAASLAMAVSNPHESLERLIENSLAPVELASSLDASFAQNAASSSVTQAVHASGSASGSSSGGSFGTGGNKLTAGAEFFGVKATGNLFIYVVDCSPSMRRDNAFEAAKQEIARSLQSMKTTQRYYIFFFAKEIERMEGATGIEEDYPLYATKENVEGTLAWLSRTRIQRDGWPPNQVLKEAIAMQPDGIFLLFDGDTRADVPGFLAQNNRTNDLFTGPIPKVPIHVVHFFQEEFVPSMRKVAMENQGTYRFIPRQSRTNPSRAGVSRAR